MHFATGFGGRSSDLSRNCFYVATIVNEKHKKVWNVMKIIVPLQCQKSTKRLATEKKRDF